MDQPILFHRDYSWNENNLMNAMILLSFLPSLAWLLLALKRQNNQSVFAAIT